MGKVAAPMAYFWLAGTSLLVLFTIQINCQSSLPTSEAVSASVGGTDNGMQNLLLLSNIFGGGLSSFGGLGGFGFPSLGGSIGAGLGSLGTGGALTTLPIVGDFRKFNQVLNGKCVIVGSGCKASNSVCTAIISSVQNVGICKCKPLYILASGTCYSILDNPSGSTATLFPPGVDLG